MPTPAQLFDWTNGFAMLGWVALVFAPLRRPLLVAAARVVAVVLAVVYAVMLGWQVANPAPGAGVDFTSLAGVMGLFTSPTAMVIGWAHYLAFDLWVGSWEAETAPGAGVPHWVVVPCLVLTLLAGPVGLLLFLLARAICRRRAAT